MSAIEDPRALKIREQLQDYARMRSELATAQAHLSKTAVQWRQERGDRLISDKQHALRQLGGTLKLWFEVKICRFLRQWYSSRSIPRRRFDDVVDAQHLLLIDPESAAAEEQRSARRKGLELFAESPQDAIAYLVQHRAVLGDVISVAAFLSTQPGLERTQLSAYLLEPRPFNRAVLGHFVSAMVQPLRVRRPDIALRHLVQKLEVPRAADQNETIVRLFAAAYLGSDCPNRAPMLEALVRLAKAVLALDLSAHPTARDWSRGLASLVPTLSTVMSLPDFLRLNEPSGPGALTLPEDMLRRVYTAACRSPLGTPPARGFYSVERDAWEDLEDPSLWNRLGGLIQNSNPPSEDKQPISTALAAVPPLDASAEVRQLSLQESNRMCVDCGLCSDTPLSYVVMDSLGFVCDECATLHAKICLHEVRHVASAQFAPAEAELLRGGNLESRNVWMFSHDDQTDPRPVPDSPELMESFFRLKYAECRWRMEGSTRLKCNMETAAVLLGSLGAVLGGYDAWRQGADGERIPGVTTAAAKEVFGQVAAAMHDSGTAQGLLQWVLQLMRRITSAGSVSLYVRQEDRLHCVGMSSVHAGFCVARHGVAVGSGITGRAARDARLIRVREPLADSRFDAEADMEQGVTTRSMLVVPVLDSKGLAAAVFRLCNKVSDKQEGFALADVAAMRVLIDGHVDGVGGLQPEEEIEDPEVDSTEALLGQLSSKEGQLEEQKDSEAIQELNREIEQLRARLDGRERVQAQLAGTNIAIERDSLQVRARVGEAKLGGHTARNDSGDVVKLKAELQSLNRYNAELQAELFSLQLRVHGHSDFADEQHTVKYVDLRKQIESSDLADMQGLHFIDVLGLDCKDRPVVVVSAANIPEGVDRFRLLMYTVDVLRNVASNEYVIVYLNTRNEYDYVHKLDFGWLKQELGMLPMAFRKNVAQVVVLHPDVWFKMQVVGMFLDSQDAQKLVYTDTVEQVYEAIGRRRLELPGYVYTSAVEKDTLGLKLGRGLDGGKELLAKTKALRHSTKAKAQEIRTRRDLLHRNKVSVDWLEKELAGFLAKENYVEAAVLKEDIAALHREIEDLELDLEALEGE